MAFRNSLYFHDLNMVRYISHRMVVMYLGAVMEEGPVLDFV